MGSTGTLTHIDSLLNTQRDRVGDYSSTLFDAVDGGSGQNGLSPKSLDDYRFLLAYLPLADLAVMSGDDMMDNINLAQEAMSSFPWSGSVSEEMYRHFILPHRISQEPFVNGWRRQFLEELLPLVKEMSMSEAALRVNHWCLEKATFKQTSGRDQDPLTTIRSGFGRCEEEMIFTIAAMRSIGIPARQCYTPYWAHADNNHAWVEVWTDGNWSYLGACEPKQNLSEAWFTRSAGRAMLVVSTAYGNYNGSEPVLKEYTRSTTINSTSVYGDVRDISISVLDKKGNPQANQRVIFSLFNYGGFMPALSLLTDEFGKCNLVSGNGSWIVSSGDGSRMDVIDINADTESIELILNHYSKESALKSIDYFPPKSPPAPASTPSDSLFSACITQENESREANLWNYWANEAGFIVENATSLKPSEYYIFALSLLAEVDSTALIDMMINSRGNWGNIYHFLTGNYPDGDGTITIQSNNNYSKPNIQDRFQLLSTLANKDLRDFDLDILADHYQSALTTNEFTIEILSNLTPSSVFNNKNDELKKIYLEYVLTPRIGREPSSSWRGDLTRFFNSHPSLIDSKKDKKLLKWIKKNIAVEEQRDRLGPGLTPSQTLDLRRGSIRDIELCYVGLCRVRGIPARFNSVSNELERWNGEGWSEIRVQSKKSKKLNNKQGSLYINKILFDQNEVLNANQMPDSPEDWHKPVEDGAKIEVLYFRDWVVQKWEKDHFTAMDFGYKKPFSEIEWPQKLSVGTYCISSGLRQEDGSAMVKLTWFEVKKNRDSHEILMFR